MSSPRKRIVPDVGLSRPVMQLTNVVFPAPLGPRTPRISPLRIVRSTPATAARPPKRLVIWRASRIGVPGSGLGTRDSELELIVTAPVCALRLSPFALRRFSLHPARPHIGEKQVAPDSSPFRTRARQSS